MDPLSNNDQLPHSGQLEPTASTMMRLPTPGGSAGQQLQAMPQTRVEPTFQTPGYPMPQQAPQVQTAVPAGVPMLTPTVPVYPLSDSSARPGDEQQSPWQPVENVDVPSEAADNDVIEKIWVIKAKQIVEDTRLNPYKQVRELNKLKAEYMKKRYDKDLKMPGA